MRWRDSRAGAGLGAALSLPWLALSYLGWQAGGLPFFPFDMFDYLARQLPGGLVTMSIDVMVFVLQTLPLGPTADLAKLVEMILALVVANVGFALAGALFGALPFGRSNRAVVAGAALGGLMWLTYLPAGLEAAWGGEALTWLLVLNLTWGATLGWALLEARRLAPASAGGTRRSFLARLGASALAVTAAGLGLGWLLRRDTGPAATQPEQPLSFLPPPTPVRPEGFEPIPGVRPELTPIEDFYRIDINLLPPRLATDTWRLALNGLVEQPLTLGYADLNVLPAEDFYATLECISNRVGGDLISTTWFTGVPLRTLLERARVQPAAVDIKFTCSDGYTESLPLEAALDPQTRLCFGMGGQPLTAAHGAPARLFTPNRFGMKNPKWITQIEAVGDDYRGYWEQRGWTEPAWVKTTAVIDASAASSGTVTVAGIAYAGARGIRQVEVRVDDGPWLAAELRPPLSDLTWVLWRAELAAAPGRHEVTVRAIDGTGAVQTEQRSPPHPDGASGYHDLSVQWPVAQRSIEYT